MTSPGNRTQMTSIARFQSAAEAGFFALELKLSENIAVVIEAEDAMDPQTGVPSDAYLLMVPREFAQSAAQALAMLVEQTESLEYESRVAAESAHVEPETWESSELSRPLFLDEEFEASESINWVPIVVTLAAGSLALWGVKQLWEPARPRAAVPAKETGKRESEPFHESCQRFGKHENLLLPSGSKEWSRINVPEFEKPGLASCG